MQDQRDTHTPPVVKKQCYPVTIGTASVSNSRIIVTKMAVLFRGQLCKMPFQVSIPWKDSSFVMFSKVAKSSSQRRSCPVGTCVAWGGLRGHLLGVHMQTTNRRVIWAYTQTLRAQHYSALAAGSEDCFAKHPSEWFSSVMKAEISTGITHTRPNKKNISFPPRIHVGASL